jgi:hypothetical protein
MFVMHCTKKEQDRLKVKPVDTLPGPTTRLGIGIAMNLSLPEQVSDLCQ